MQVAALVRDECWERGKVGAMVEVASNLRRAFESESESDSVRQRRNALRGADLGSVAVDDYRSARTAGEMRPNSTGSTAARRDLGVVVAAKRETSGKRIEREK
jgi:hypothetical protein